VFDPNSKIKVFKTCFWKYHSVGEEDRNPLVKLRWRTDMLHARTCHLAPTRRLPTRTDALHVCHAPSSPVHHFLTRAGRHVIIHVIESAQSSATSHVQSAVPTSICHVWFWGRFTYVSATLSEPHQHWSFDSAWQSHCFTWNVAWSAPFIGLKVWLIKSESFKV